MINNKVLCFRFSNLNNMALPSFGSFFHTKLGRNELKSQEKIQDFSVNDVTTNAKFMPQFINKEQRKGNQKNVDKSISL